MNPVPVSIAWLVGSIALAASATPAEQVDRIADRYYEARLSHFPELPYFVGLQADRHDALSDNSATGRAAWEGVEDELLAELSAVPSADLMGSPAWITHGVLKELLESGIGMRVCRSAWWNVNHMGGWQGSYGRLADYQPVGEPALREQALARWAKFDTFVDNEIANLSEGLEHGYSAPKTVVEKVIRQMDGLIAAPAEATPFLSPVRRDHDEAFGQAFTALFETEILPALKRYRDFLTDNYLPRAREALSVTANPEGDRCYEASLRRYTTLSRPGREVYELGQKTVAANRERVIELGNATYDLNDFEAILARAADDPAEKFENREQLLQASRDFVKKAESAMAAWFSQPPEQAVTVEPYPEFQDGTGMSSRYEAPNGDRPGIYRITLHAPEEQSRGDAEVTAVHETWPGHHLQIALAQNVRGVHKVARVAFNSGFIEGWARYAEALGEEMGLYETDSAPITRRAWPARGMVVDPGLHLNGWTREQIRDYVLESRRMGPTRATDLADRIAVLPGQLTAYDSGALEIFALREEAERVLGDRFDIKAFHDRVLENGVVPLPLLRAHVEAWIRSEAARTGS